MKIKQIISDRPWLLAVLVTGAVLLWIASGYVARGISSPVAKSGDETATPATVRVQARVQSAQPITRYISVYGRSAPARAVEVRAETDGRVEAIIAKRGERLKEGDTILRLDLRDRQARLEQARAGVTEHKTAYEGQRKLKAEGYVSDTQIAETLAKLEAARAELTRAKLDLQYRVIRAPFDGVILERPVELGDFVRAGDEIANFVDNTSVIITGSIAEQDARYVSQGTVASAELVTGQKLTGRIRYLAPVADEATRTFTVELEIPNPDGSIPAGVTAEMRVPGGEIMAQKVAPSLLTLDTDGTIGLKAVDDFNRVVFYPVEIARTDKDGVWVSGLPETTSVITIGQGYAQVGELVDPVFAETDTALAAEAVQ